MLPLCVRLFFILLNKQRLPHPTMLFRPVFYSCTNTTHFKELAKTTSFSFFLKGWKYHEYHFTEHYENPGGSLSNWSWGNTSLRWSDLTTDSAWGGAELTRPASAALTHKISQWGLSHHRAGPKSTDQEPPGIPQRFWPQQKQNRKKASFLVSILHFGSSCSLEETC